MKTAILSTGSELIRGTISDTNAQWIAQRLFERGIPPEKILAVSDHRTHVSTALHDLWRDAELVICTGGLGPTTDDITAEAVADAMGVPTVRHSIAQQQVEARFAERGIPMAPINLKQADLPEGAEVLENPIGTAPGFAVIFNGKCAVFLPGVPAEMKSMFHRHVIPRAQTTQPKRCVRLVRTFGIGESVLQERVLPIEQAFPSISFSYRAAFPTVTTVVLGENAELVNTAHRQLQEHLAEYIVAVEDKTIAQVVGEQLLAKGLTIATAESCTGGQIGHELTQIAGSSAYFRGGVIAYDNAVKTALLGVDERLLQSQGAVSEEVVRQMALGVRQKLGTYIGVATSGIAGPSGGSAEKPVGTVHMAVALGEHILHKKCLFKGYSRTKVKTASTWTAMKMVLTQLLEMQ